MLKRFVDHRGPHSHISLDGTPVEIVSCFRFLGLQISNELAWTHNMGVMLKKAHQRLYPLWCLRKCSISTRWLVNIYRGTIESVLSAGVTRLHRMQALSLYCTALVMHHDTLSSHVAATIYHLLNTTFMLA